MRNASQTPTDGFRSLPSVDRLAAAVLEEAPEAAPALLVELAREALHAARGRIAAGDAAGNVQADVLRRLAALATPALRPVINATGVIIHTNLGRAPLSEAARQAMDAVSRGYSNLEYALDAGARGSRHDLVQEMLCRVTGAEAGFAVNNNAAAVLLALATLCAGREVIISRGQLVEIGGGFRIPDVLRQSGARLVEVGTTNRTYSRDYEAAITPETAAILRVHSSNFRVIGFTYEPALDELSALARERGVLLLDDLGSGCLLDTSVYGLAPEPTVQASLAAGVDLAMFSGDKLLGGPQAGIIVGRREAVERLKRHPLARALRADKGTIAALIATLRHYALGEATRAVPVWRMIAADAAQIEARAAAWAAALDTAAAVVATRAMVGGGSLPEESVPSRALALTVADPDGLARRLRLGSPAVVARIERERVLLDPRTVAPEDDALVVEALRAALAV